MLRFVPLWTVDHWLALRSAEQRLCSAQCLQRLTPERLARLVDSHCSLGWSGTHRSLRRCFRWPSIFVREVRRNLFAMRPPHRLHYWRGFRSYTAQRRAPSQFACGHRWLCLLSTWCEWVECSRRNMSMCRQLQYLVFAGSYQAASMRISSFGLAKRLLKNKGKPLSIIKSVKSLVEHSTVLSCTRPSNRLKMSTPWKQRKWMITTRTDEPAKIILHLSWL